MGKYVDEIVAYKIKEEFEKIEKEIANEETKKLVYDTLFNEPKVKIYNEITEEITPDLEKEISKNLYKTRYNLESGKWKHEDLAAIQEKCKEIINEYENRPDAPEIQRLRKC